MTHPIEIQSANIVGALRNDALQPGAREPGAHLVDGFYLSWENEEGRVELDLASEAGRMLWIGARVAQAPRWFTMNLELGTATFAPGDILGLVIELEGTGTDMLPVFVRSARGGQPWDTFLSDMIAVTPERSVCTILHRIGEEDALADGEGFHTLVMRLPKQDFDLTVHDMRLFLVPAARGFGA